MTDEARGAVPRVPSLLLLSNMYPAKDNPMFGAFIARQEAALRALGVRFRLVANARQAAGPVANSLKYASMLVRTATAALGGGFDVVVGHYLYPTAWFAAIASRLSGKPYVLVVHGTDARSVQRRDFVAARCRRALRGARLVVCVSEALAARLRRELALPESVPTAVVNMGVDRSIFRPAEDARAILQLPADARIVMFAGNLVAAKNVETLVAAFERAHEAGAADLLLLAGADPEGRRAELEADVAARGLGDAVRFLGVLEPDGLAAAMSAADVFVLPSLSEALGVVLLEAMACGTPVVASAVGGIPEVVSEACGRLVEPTDVEGFAGAIGEVIGAGKARFMECCEKTAAANDVLENTRRFLRAVDRYAGGGSR